MPAATRGSLVLLRNCLFADTPNEPEVLDLATGSVVRPRANRRFYDFNDIGTQWLAGTQQDGDPGHGGSTVPAYLNWRTGEIRRGTSAKSLDLNDPALRPLPAATCAGRPVAAKRSPRRIIALAGKRRPRLVVRSCRTGAVQVISRCRKPCSRQVVAGRVAAWTEGRRWLKVRDLSSRRTVAWKLPREAGGSFGGYYFLTVTGRTVVFGMPRPQPDGGFDAYLARLP